MMNALTFEDLQTPESLQIIRDIAADIWPKTFGSILSAEQIKYMMQMMYAPEVMEKELAEGFHFEIVKIDNLPGGYMVWSPCCEQPDTAKLHKLYLLQKYHHQGIGSAMLSHVANSLKDSGFKKVKLNVNKYNIPAKKSYLRNGFTVVEAVKIDIGNNFYMDDFVMEKELGGL